MVKRKPSEHDLEAESRGVLTQILSHWVVNDLSEDYGIDFEAHPVDQKDEERRVLPTAVSIQLKATESFDDDRAVYSLDSDSLEFYMELRKPVVLALYEQESGEIFWTVVQTNVWDNNIDEKDWMKQSTVQIEADKGPLSETLDELVMTVQNAEERIVRHHVENTFAEYLHDFVGRSEIATALDNGESERLELKRSLPSVPNSILKNEVSALANTEGGAIIFGITDSGNVVGVEEPESTRDRIETTIKQGITPAVDGDVTILYVEEKPVIVVRIPKYDNLPHSVEGVFYRRVGTRIEKMDAYDLKELF